jgi:THO complex subunit 2
MEPRRMTSNSSLANEYRRDAPPANAPSRAEQIDRPIRPSHATTPAKEEPTVNPARAALINQVEHGRSEPPRSSDRDSRRERDTPRHGEDRRGDDRRVEERPPVGYHGRTDAPRDHIHRDERSQAPTPGIRDRRDEPTTVAPTGPRGGRNEPAAASRASREMFEPTTGPRSSVSQVRDPNYGRLNQPSEPAPPSGPRSMSNQPNHNVQSLTNPGDRPHAPAQPSTPTAPTGPAASLPAGIHPSRLNNIEGRPVGPPLQTNVPNAPSGPRGSNRVPQGPIPSSPVGPRPPTGPAVVERGPRNAGNPLRAINNVLTGNAPADRSSERNNASPSNPPVRGRGATRANGPVEGAVAIANPMPPPGSTPNRVENQLPSRSSRNDEAPVPEEGGRSESRSHRRSERSGRDRSPERSDRERGSGREKRGGDRESSRRDREREGEPTRSGREPRESRSGRERGSRDEGRSGREDRPDRRSRGGGGGGSDEGRKRGRDPTDTASGDQKRRR